VPLADAQVVPAVSSPPFTLSANQDALFKARNDISAGEIKIYKDIDSVNGEVHLLLNEKEAEEVYNLTEGDKVEIGPFVVRVPLSQHISQ